jgi:hypothetical protein
MDTVFNFCTEHDTTNRMMTQKLEQFTIVTDWQRTTIKVFKGNDLVQSVNFGEIYYTIGDFENLLRNVELSANKLKEFKDA